MPRRAGPRLLGGSRHDDAQSELPRAQSDVDVHVVDSRVREDPQRVTRVEVVSFHDRVAVARSALDKQELMDAHLSRYARKERERELDHRMKPDEAADARIHLLHRNRRMADPERMHPPLGRDGVGHELRGAPDGRQLCSLDVGHDGTSVGEPLESEHSQSFGIADFADDADLAETRVTPKPFTVVICEVCVISEICVQVVGDCDNPTLVTIRRRETTRSPASNVNATGTITNDPADRSAAPSTPVRDGNTIPPTSASTITMLNAVPD